MHAITMLSSRMAQLLVRDIPEEAVAALKRNTADFWAEADRLRKELEDQGRVFTDSTAILREDRDTR
ncbi:MAG: hypothetical protein WDM91_00720 [Rhizomicrobium sp.]